MALSTETMSYHAITQSNTFTNKVRFRKSTRT